MNILTRNKSILDGWRGAGDVPLARGEGTRWRNGSHTTALATPGAWERAGAARKNAEALAEARLAILTARKNAAEKEEEEAKASYAAGVDWWARSRYSEGNTRSRAHYNPGISSNRRALSTVVAELSAPDRTSGGD